MQQFNTEIAIHRAFTMLKNKHAKHAYFREGLEYAMKDALNDYRRRLSARNKEDQVKKEVRLQGII